MPARRCRSCAVSGNSRPRTPSLAHLRRGRARERGDQRRLEPKVVTPSAKRQAIALLVSEHCLSVVPACQVARLARAPWYRPPQDRLARNGPVIEALNAQVEQNRRWASGSCLTGCTTSGTRGTPSACTGCIAPCASIGPGGPSAGSRGGRRCRCWHLPRLIRPRPSTSCRLTQARAAKLLGVEPAPRERCRAGAPASLQH